MQHIMYILFNHFVKWNYFTCSSSLSSILPHSCIQRSGTRLVWKSSISSTTILQTLPVTPLHKFTVYVETFLYHIEFFTIEPNPRYLFACHAKSGVRMLKHFLRILTFHIPFKTLLPIIFKLCYQSDFLHPRMALFPFQSNSLGSSLHIAAKHVLLYYFLQWHTDFKNRVLNRFLEFSQFAGFVTAFKLFYTMSKLFQYWVYSLTLAPASPSRDWIMAKIRASSTLYYR